MTYFKKGSLKECKNNLRITRSMLDYIKNKHPKIFEDAKRNQIKIMSPDIEKQLSEILNVSERIENGK